MALSGVVLQGLTRNPIAEPGIGLNSGAALAVVLIRFLGLTTVTGTSWPPSSAPWWSPRSSSR